MLEEWDTEKLREARLSGGQQTYRSIFEDDHEQYRWSEWSQLTDTNRLYRFVRDEVFLFMAELPGIREDVRRFFQGAQLQIPDGATLRDVIDLFRDINFIELDADIKGDLYEHLLNQLATSGRAGQFRTPRHIIRMIVQLVNPKIGETILDLALGTGGFLIGAYEWIKLQNSDPANITERPNGSGQSVKRGYGDRLNKTQWDFLRAQTFYGFDVDAHIHKIGTMNLILHGLDQSTILRRDAIAGSPDDWEDRQFDCILSNPPFAGSINKERIRKTLPVISPKTEILFLGLMLDALRNNGRCGVIVPEGLLFGATSAHKEIRRLLLEKCDLQAVVSLPAGVFQPYSGVKTSVLVFAKGKPTKSVWFYELTADGFSLDQKRLPTPDKTDIPDLLAKWPNRQASERSWVADIDTIRAADYNLSAGRYKPQTIEVSHHEPPTKILEEVSALERDIQARLDRLKASLSEGSQ
jgi:type I restriction enzyme M protein